VFIYIILGYIPFALKVIGPLIPGIGRAPLLYQMCQILSGVLLSLLGCPCAALRVYGWMGHKAMVAIAMMQHLIVAVMWQCGNGRAHDSGDSRACDSGDGRTHDSGDGDGSDGTGSSIMTIALC
jgi:hypothetical protein